MIRARKLHHASIRVRDLSRSREFYEGLLHMPLAERPEMGFPGAWYGLGEGQVHLIELPKTIEGVDPTDPHFAVEVDDLEAAKRELLERDIPFREIGPAVWVHDPDGHVVELRAAGAQGAGRLSSMGDEVRKGPAS